MENIFLASLPDLGGLWGLLGVLFGGSVVKLLEWFITRGKAKVDDATAIRVELRGEIRELNKEKDDLDKSVDHWKGKYWEEHEKLIKMSARFAFLVSKLEECKSTVPQELLETFKGFVLEYYGVEGFGTKKSNDAAVRVIEQTIKEVEGKDNA